MNWLFDALRLPLPTLNEPLVDCDNCQLKKPLSRVGDYQPKTKCCDFSPYWSLFAAGAWLEEGHNLKTLPGFNEKNLIFSKIGIMHSLDHRRRQEKLCLHFDSSSLNCSIWRHRPPTCFTFFCASQHSLGLKQYGVLEDWLLSVEAAALQLYFKKEGLPADTWEQWSEYMELSPTLESLPRELTIDTSDIKEVEAHYRESYLWLKSSEDCKSLRSQVAEAWDIKFSNHPYF